MTARRVLTVLEAASWAFAALLFLLLVLAYMPHWLATTMFFSFLWFGCAESLKRAVTAFDPKPVRAY